jgi:hypothetical protein
MNQSHSTLRRGATLAVTLALALGALPAHAERQVNERRPAAAQGRVEIVNVAGSVEVRGWERAEVEVTGTLGDAVERLDFTSTGDLTSIRVVLPKGGSYRGNGDATLVVHVPARSSLSASLVSADANVAGVLGSLQLKSVSGNVVGESARDVRISTVSGDVQLDAKQGTNLVEVRTISGDLRVRGAAAGEIDVNSVSGDATVDVTSISRGRFKTVSGDMRVAAALATDGRFEAESVSGDVTVDFRGAAPPAEYDVETFSGSIRNCFGPKAQEPEYGPGSRLTFRQGAGTARVSVDTKSGDVRLCAR